MSITQSRVAEDYDRPSVVPVARSPFRRVAIGAISAAIPGVGHLVLGQRKKATALLILLVLLLLAFWPFRVLQYYAGFVGLFGSWIVLGVYASCSAFLSRDNLESRRPSKWWLLLLAPAALVILSLTGAAVTRLTGFRSFQIPSTGMEPTIRQGDRIVADMRYYRSRLPGRLETVLFEKGEIFYIKRVIAVGGDLIEGKNRVIYVNGRELDEPYIEHIAEAPEWANTFGPVSVPAGKFFVMGDNRDYSLDSRSEEYGLVDQAFIVGKPLYVFESDRAGQLIH